MAFSLGEGADRNAGFTLLVASGASALDDGAMTARLLAAFVLLTAVSAAQESEVLQLPEVRIIAQGESGREIRIGDALFTVYRTDGDPAAPLCYPIFGPGEVAMMRRYPFEEVEGEPRDHLHHRSLWFAHGDMNGVDFWAARKGGATIRHDGFLTLAKDDALLAFGTHNTWLAPDGEVVCTDQRALRFLDGDGDIARGIDHQVTFRASHGELRFGDTKEGLFGFRMAPWLALKGEGATGRVFDSEGHVGDDVWGKRARWIAYLGRFEGATYGFVMMDHPSNLRHPTWWHARDYGLAAANPFGQHDFEGVKGTPGDYVLAADATLTLRHRIVFFKGAMESERIDAWFADFARVPAITLPDPEATAIKKQPTEDQEKRR